MYGTDEGRKSTINIKVRAIEQIWVLDPFKQNILDLNHSNFYVMEKFSLYGFHKLGKSDENNYVNVQDTKVY